MVVLRIACVHSWPHTKEEMNQNGPSVDAASWLDAVSACLLTTTPHGRITFANAAARALFTEEVVGTPLGVHIIRGGQPLQAVEELLERGESSFECKLAQGGAEVQVEVLARGEGEEQSFVVLVHMTNAEHQRELRKFERLAAMGTMVAGFAHEVLNPVASMRSLTESLDEELADAGMKFPHIGRMMRVLERMERLVRTSLQFGRPEPPRRARHRPWSLLSNALEAIGPRLRAMGQQDVRVEVEPELPDVCVDDEQIAQVLVIFLNNALDATLAPRRVLLRARRETAMRGAPLRIEVENEGPGISREDLSRIFDPFFTTKPTGTGLGLPIAQQLVNENGARLEVATTPEGPTRFSVLVPLEEL